MDGITQRGRGGPDVTADQKGSRIINHICLPAGGFLPPVFSAAVRCHAGRGDLFRNRIAMLVAEKFINM